MKLLQLTSRNLGQYRTIASEFADAIVRYFLTPYKDLLTTPKALTGIWKSLFPAVSSATICSVIGTAVVAVRKSKLSAHKLLLFPVPK